MNHPVPPPPPSSLVGKFTAMRNMLRNCLIERDDEVNAIIRCAIANEHLLLVGDPGTAKSLLCSSFGKAFHDARVFEVLLTKYSTPEDCFGAIDINALKQGSYRRRIDRYMPTAHICFCDETFKASTAILNSLLTMMNERQYDNDGQRIQCPLRVMVGASNEWPQGEELGAMFDRFLVRRVVRPASPLRLEDLLFDTLGTPSPVLTIAEWDKATEQAMDLPVSKDAKGTLVDILEALESEGVTVGDRRKRKAIRIAKAEAWLNHATEVLPIHLEPLCDVLWSEPVEQPAKALEIVTKLSNPQQCELNKLMNEIRQLDQQIRTSVEPSVQAAASRKYAEIEQTARAMNTERSLRVADHCKRQAMSIAAAALGLRGDARRLLTQ